jgi:hypothetical protein
MPICGVIQAVIAGMHVPAESLFDLHAVLVKSAISLLSHIFTFYHTRDSIAKTFTFLPKKKEPGYVAFGDIGALSYNYVVENSFFASLLAFQWLYYDDRFYLPFFRKTILIELGFVFLPYMPFIRGQWPISSFRDSFLHDKGKSDEKKEFFYWSILRTKFFYIFAKHYIGFFLNYMRITNRVGPAEQKLVYGLLLGKCLSPRVAFDRLLVYICI